MWGLPYGLGRTAEVRDEKLIDPNFAGALGGGDEHEFPEGTIWQPDVHVTDDGVLGPQHVNAVAFVRDATFTPSKGQTVGNGQLEEPSLSETGTPVAIDMDANG